MDDLEKVACMRWKDAPAIETVITQKIPKSLALDQAYQNARRYSDPENARIEGELAIERAISAILSDYIELFQLFTQSSEFKEQIASVVLRLTDGQRPS